ncbi:sodium-coupled monocarboxylate transporter 1-like [Coccinella septempunctata]|uniref:sodium-coupled monocarboxylate transporter 1-like n=1 Tax=Coccinella septempunctata TaxID=41139 RepID=UPI001D088B79|nr:sodium-coupled monocarboxylate transporter 1-like [Coccinella septempunctata]
MFRRTMRSEVYFGLFLVFCACWSGILGKETEDAPLDHENTFSWADYLVLGSMLFISCGIGVFYGFFSNKHDSSEDFLLGGSEMGTIPMSFSLAASFVTAIELLGNPSEMYNYGLQFWMICIAFLTVVPLTSTFYLPVFMELRLTSSYEYFSLRFNPTARYIASGLYIFQMVLYTSVAVFAPALALSKVTGLNVYLAVTGVYMVCIFYASQGGMKAVIIADTFQTFVLIGSLISIVWIGQTYLGPDAKVWLNSYQTERLEIFNFTSDMTVRHSFWSVVIGGTFYWLTMFCSNQASIQKYMSVQSISQVKKALWVSAFGLILVYSLNFYTGMIMVTRFKDCDPLKSSAIGDPDELLPFYVMREMGHLKGMMGFFVAGIFAASLGTVASALNSLSAVTMEDFIEGALKFKVPESKGAFWAKCISIIYGAISFALVFIVAKLGSVMQVAISFNGMVGGVTLGLFTLGMFFPSANSKGAIFGSIVAVAVITLMCIGQQIYIASGSLEEITKATCISGCLQNTTEITTTIIGHEEISPISDPIFVLYRVSYIWYSMIGFLITVIMGLLASFATGSECSCDIDERLLTPIVRNHFLSKGKLDLNSKLTGTRRPYRGNSENWWTHCLIKFYGDDYLFIDRQYYTPI